jgi:hypothetical protein
MKIPRILLAGLAALVCAVLGLCGCSGESAAMRMLEGDPMAAEDLLGLTLVKTEKYPPPGALKAASPAIYHWFAPPEDVTRQEALARLSAFAKACGYSTFSDSTTSEMWVGTRFANPETVGVSISIGDIVGTGSDDAELVGTIEVIVSYV